MILFLMTARAYRDSGSGSVVVGEENFGEGSSREHAAMEPRFLGVKVVLVKSFARIHETNLKKQGVLTLTFQNKEDYNKIREDDRIDITGLNKFAAGQTVDCHSESFRRNKRKISRQTILTMNHRLNGLKQEVH